MKIALFGMGYVGCVSAACMAKNGHKITGIDVDKNKIDILKEGKSPIIEMGLEDAIQSASLEGRLTAALNGGLPDEVLNSDVSFVCVGTPSNENGSLKNNYLKKVVAQIGEIIKKHNGYHVVNIRSTVLPGTIEDLVIPILEEKSGKKAGNDFGVCMNPEFLREGTAISDYFDPPFTIIGELTPESGNMIAEIYRNIEAPIFRTSIKSAEMVKYACNLFHALKITFANEVGNICKKLSIDSHEVMKLFCEDKKLNLSSYYLKPGFAFGGSCLPKDLRAILYLSKHLDIDTPVLNSILPSNNKQIETAFNMIMRSGYKSIGLLGLSFKPGTDDLRESPIVDLAERLIGKGYKLSIYDREVSLARLYGSNKRFIESVIPHISSLMKSTAGEVVESSEVVVFGSKCDEHEKIIASLDNGKQVIDLVNMGENTILHRACYQGICW